MFHLISSRRSDGVTRPILTRAVLVASATVLFATAASGAEAAGSGPTTYRPDPQSSMAGGPVPTWPELNGVPIKVLRLIGAAQAANVHAALADLRY